MCGGGKRGAKRYQWRPEGFESCGSELEPQVSQSSQTVQLGVAKDSNTYLLGDIVDPPLQTWIIQSIHQIYVLMMFKMTHKKSSSNVIGSL